MTTTLNQAMQFASTADKAELDRLLAVIRARQEMLEVMNFPSRQTERRGRGTSGSGADLRPDGGRVEPFGGTSRRPVDSGASLSPNGGRIEGFLDR